jgi:hypothetical protein
MEADTMTTDELIARMRKRIARELLEIEIKRELGYRFTGRSATSAAK